MAEKTSTAAKAAHNEDYYNELVDVKLFQDNDKYKDDVFVAVNGVGMIVPRGKNVKIPRKYALALKQAQHQANASDEYQKKLAEKAKKAESEI